MLGCGEPLALQCCPSQWLRRAEETNPSGASHGVHGKSGQATHPQTLGWTAMTTTEGKCPALDWQGGMCWEQGWGQHSPGVVCTLHVLVLCTADKTAVGNWHVPELHPVHCHPARPWWDELRGSVRSRKQLSWWGTSILGLVR